MGNYRNFRISVRETKWIYLSYIIQERTAWRAVRSWANLHPLSWKLTGYGKDSFWCPLASRGTCFTRSQWTTCFCFIIPDETLPAHFICPCAHNSKLAQHKTGMGISSFSGAVVSCQEDHQLISPTLCCWDHDFLLLLHVEVPNFVTMSLVAEGNWSLWYKLYGIIQQLRSYFTDPGLQIHWVPPFLKKPFSSHFPWERFPFWPFNTEKTAPLWSKDSTCSPSPAKVTQASWRKLGRPTAPLHLMCNPGKLPSFGLVPSLSSLWTIGTILPLMPFLLAVHTAINPWHCWWPPASLVGASITHTWHIPSVPQVTLRRLEHHSKQGGLPFYLFVFLLILCLMLVMEHHQCNLS